MVMAQLAETNRKNMISLSKGGYKKDPSDHLNSSKRAWPYLSNQKELKANIWHFLIGHIR